MTRYFNPRNLIGMMMVGIILLIVGPLLMSGAQNAPLWTILFGGLLVAGGTIWAGEVQIHSRHLTGTSEKVARYATFALAALVAGFTVYGTWSFGAIQAPGAGGFVATLYGMATQSGYTLVITTAIILLGGTIIYGGIAKALTGDGAVARIAFRIFFAMVVLGAVVIWLLTPARTGRVVSAVQGSAQRGVDQILANPQLIADFNWGQFVGWAFFGICIIAIGMFLLKGNKLVMLAFAVTASLLVFPTAFYYSWTYVVPEPVKEAAAAAGLTVQNNNPFAGDTREADLRHMDYTGIPDFGPNDILNVHLPFGGCVAKPRPTTAWLAANANLFRGYTLDTFVKDTWYHLGDSTWELAESFKTRLQVAGERIDLEIQKSCSQP